MEIKKLKESAAVRALVFLLQLRRLVTKIGEVEVDIG
jgi:hypothetical protein